ncbi:response regulator transcription factor [Planotetraspora sp. A-T 1434]|uniref:response regulator transcription factor n=1 Tax=Planotetraspora sp. A-T 1434 TaxID=2979219 RepID=UPI0021C1D22C|nr:response regulator transcription factor [Planotetraspora sp. A-T 1434]MCT9934167.1 response regulator transcription factor [Planotetraspora sp. A-T 1434]
MVWDRDLASPPSAPTSPARLAILDGDPLLRAGLRSILERDARVEIISEFGSVRQVAAHSGPFVLVAGGESLDQLLPDIAKIFPATGPSVAGVVGVLRPDDPAMLRKAITCAVRGFVDRDNSHRDLADAVLGVSRGDAFLSPAIADVLVGWVATQISLMPVPIVTIERMLTGRELEVFQALGDGLSNSAIARKLRIRETTVRSHVYRILNKLDLGARAEAVLAGHCYANALRGGR